MAAFFSATSINRPYVVYVFVYVRTYIHTYTKALTELTGALFCNVNTCLLNVGLTLELSR